MRQGLIEWAIVTALLALAAAGASARWGDDVRGAFGVRGPAAVQARSPAAPERAR